MLCVEIKHFPLKTGKGDKLDFGNLLYHTQMSHNIVGLLPTMLPTISFLDIWIQFNVCNNITFKIADECVMLENRVTANCTNLDLNLNKKEIK